jgi:SAM-dependent methyltransferase
MSTKIKKSISDYYADKLKKFGRTPQGVDWNSEESQIMRFDQLIKLLPDNYAGRYSVLDYGCGYGALLDFLMKRYSNLQYTGFDISEEMIASCRSKFDFPFAHWTHIENQLKENDYVIASGIFNVKMDFPDVQWREYIRDTLQIINKLAVKGFAFNILTSYSDKPYMKENLFYADPCWIFDYCKRNFSKSVALLHDYPLYEFTLLVRK